MMRESEKQPFLDTVRYVHWVQSEDHYCIHVDYDSDSDSEDIDRWKVKSRLCGGENVYVVVQTNQGDIGQTDPIR